VFAVKRRNRLCGRLMMATNGSRPAVELARHTSMRDLTIHGATCWWTHGRFILDFG